MVDVLVQRLGANLWPVEFTQKMYVLIDNALCVQMKKARKTLGIKPEERVVSEAGGSVLDQDRKTHALRLDVVRG